MTIELSDSRSLEIRGERGEVEIWLYDSLVRTSKLIGVYKGGKYVESHPELFQISASGFGPKILKAIRTCYEQPQAEFSRRLTCLRRSIVLKVLLLRRSL